MTDKMLIEDIERCPVHAEPDSNSLNTWPCPFDCEHFGNEMVRRLYDVRVKGNFTRMTFRKGRVFTQEYRNHKPVSRWKHQYPDWKNLPRQLHIDYRAKRRGRW